MIEYRAQRLLRPTLKRSEGARPRVEGYGAVFYDPDDPGTEYQLWEDCIERIDPACFNRALAEKHPVRSCINHDPNNILARLDAGTLQLRVDKKGLWYSAEIPDTTVGNDLVKNLENGNYDGSSFSFDLTGRRLEQAKVGDRFVTYRYLTDCTLHELGPVLFPAYESTTADKRSRNFQDVREEVSAWRKSLQSERDAEAVAVRLATLRVEQAV
jgi:HK97 family phage prohead protease